MGVKVANNAHSTLATGISNTDTILNLAPGTGSKFPNASVASGNYFYLTLINVANQIEVVKVTGRVVDACTIVRGQDGTTGRAFLVGDRAELRPTAALFEDLPIRKLVTADYDDGSITPVKLADTGVSAGIYGSSGFIPRVTVNAKGQITSITEQTIAQRGYQVFTASGTFTPPQGVTKVKVTVIAAGGNGGIGYNTTVGGYSEANPGGGGGAGGCVVTYVDVSGACAVTIGTNAGTRTSSFAGNTTVSATGGSNGTNGSNTNEQATNGTKGADGAYTVFGRTQYTVGLYRDSSGGYPGTAEIGSLVTQTGGVHGHGYGAAGGRASTGNGIAAVGHGGGGGGGAGDADNRTGGLGSNGLVVVEW